MIIKSNIERLEREINILKEYHKNSYDIQLSFLYDNDNNFISYIIELSFLDNNYKFIKKFSINENIEKIKSLL